MRSILQSIGLFLMLPAVAQNAYLQTGVFNTADFTTNSTIQLPAGIAFRWKASDLSSSPVSIWTDEIQGNNFTASGALRPTWDANGVHFTGTPAQYMVTTNVTVGLWGALLAVVSYTTVGQEQIIGGSGRIVGNVGVPGQWVNICGGGNFGATTTSQYYDFIGTTVYFSRVYTNGVVGIIPACVSSDIWTYIGQYSSGEPFYGTLREIIVWTNVLNFTNAANIALVHKYATNTYNYGP